MVSGQVARLEGGVYFFRKALSEILMMEIVTCGIVFEDDDRDDGIFCFVFLL